LADRGRRELIISLVSSGEIMHDPAGEAPTGLFALDEGDNRGP